VVLAGERFADEPVGAQLDLADFFEDVAGDHTKGEVGSVQCESALALVTAHLSSNPYCFGATLDAACQLLRWG
jgi:glutathione S-transferase